MDCWGELGGITIQGLATSFRNFFVAAWRSSGGKARWRGFANLNTTIIIRVAYWRLLEHEQTCKQLMSSSRSLAAWHRLSPHWFPPCAGSAPRAARHPCLRRWCMACVAVAHQLVYCYLTLFTSTIFIVLGAVLGMQEDHLRRLAATDGLTGLLNRRYFSLRLSQELARAKR